MVRCEGLKLGDKKWVQECDGPGRAWGGGDVLGYLQRRPFVIFGFFMRTEIGKDAVTWHSRERRNARVIVGGTVNRLRACFGVGLETVNVL